MAVEVFNRYENKYMLDEKTLLKMQNRLSDYMEPDEYNKNGGAYTISNLYYDTGDSSLIRASLKKPRYKEKLRLRAYGAPNGDSMAYAEIKKKVCGLVNKRRSAMKLREAYAFLETGTVSEPRPYMNRQVLHEIGYILERYELSPALYLAYDRFAYFGIGQHDLRVSFDTGIVTRRHDLRLESGVYGERLLPEGAWLMEVKAAQSIPVWLCRLLSEHNVFPVSFSKYGVEYTQSLAGRAPQGKPAALPHTRPEPARAFRPAVSF